MYTTKPLSTPSFLEANENIIFETKPGKQYLKRRLIGVVSGWLSVLFLIVLFRSYTFPRLEDALNVQPLDLGSLSPAQIVLLFLVTCFILISLIHLLKIYILIRRIKYYLTNKRIILTGVFLTRRLFPLFITPSPIFIELNQIKEINKAQTPRQLQQKIANVIVSIKDNIAINYLMLGLMPEDADKMIHLTKEHL